MPLQFRHDGKLYVRRMDRWPPEVDLVDIDRGERQLWQTIFPADATGVDMILRIVITPDGAWYCHDYVRFLSDLYVVEGMSDRSRHVRTFRARSGHARAAAFDRTSAALAKGVSDARDPVASAPKALSKSELQNRLWPDTFVVEKNLAIFAVEIRDALGNDAAHPQFAGVPRFGYAFRDAGKSGRRAESWSSGDRAPVSPRLAGRAFRDDGRRTRHRPRSGRRAVL